MPEEGFGAGRIWSETTRVVLHVSDVAGPRPGDWMMLGGEGLEVQGEPVRDRARLVWTDELRPLRTSASDRRMRRMSPANSGDSPVTTC